MASESPVKIWLRKLNLFKYSALLSEQGYTDEHDIFMLNEGDLDNVSIMDPSDRNTILNAVSQIDISTWLEYYKLEEYEQYFKRLGINTLAQLKERAMCDDMMDELEVMVPGHRKRLTVAASHICQPVPQEVVQPGPQEVVQPGPQEIVQPASTSQAREPVAYGYWAKNNEMQTFETDFLWVDKCKIKSNICGHDPIELLNCMVDTGSEVVTIKKDILPELNLQFLQNIKSKGIHKVEEKPLYRGVLVLGSKEIEVDVMPDSYNSVGCNVVQRFSHVIDARGHIWVDSGS